MSEISLTPPGPELTVIVATWNTRELTLRCLRSLFVNSDGVNLQVLVVDKASQDRSAEAIVAALGYRPMLTPDAEIMHLGGASAPELTRIVQNWKAKAPLIRGHGPPHWVRLGLAELWLACDLRRLVIVLAESLSARKWPGVWAQRLEGLKGY